MQAIIYVRVSTDEQVLGTSLDSQTAACLKFAKDMGLPVEEDFIFREEGESAKLIDRPELNRMFAVVAKNKGKISHCIVWKVDRLARKMEYHIGIRANLAKYGVKLVSVTEPISDDPMGTLVENMLAAYAQFENEMRLARTTAGMKARTEQGGWPHDAPYGFSKSRTPLGISTIEPNNDSQKIKMLLEKFSTGNYTVEQATSLAAKLGIRAENGKEKNWQSIKNIVSNPLYSGFVRSKYTAGKMIKGVHTAIIDEKIFYRNQAILNNHVKNYSLNADVDWPLRGGFMKHKCGSPMTGSSPTGNSGPSPRYSCPKCKVKDYGKQISRKREEVHHEFMNLLSQIQPSKGMVALFREVTLRQWNNEYKDAIARTSQLNNEVSNLKQKQSKILDLYIDGKLTEGEKDQKLNENEQLLSKLLLQELDANNYVAEKEQIIDGAMLFMSEPGLFWNLANTELKKRIQGVIFPEGVTYDCVDGYGTPTLGKSYLLIQKLAENSANNPNVVPGARIELATSGL
jgi:site-specific DNA recombinase